VVVGTLVTVSSEAKNGEENQLLTEKEEGSSPPVEKRGESVVQGSHVVAKATQQPAHLESRGV